MIHWLADSEGPTVALWAQQETRSACRAVGASRLWGSVGWLAPLTALQGIDFFSSIVTSHNTSPNTPAPRFFHPHPESRRRRA